MVEVLFCPSIYANRIFKTGKLIFMRAIKDHSILDRLA